jgi:hypothetical protein
MVPFLEVSVIKRSFFAIRYFFCFVRLAGHCSLAALLHGAASELAA